MIVHLAFWFGVMTGSNEWLPKPEADEQIAIHCLLVVYWQRRAKANVRCGGRMLRILLQILSAVIHSFIHWFVQLSHSVNEVLLL